MSACENRFRHPCFLLTCELEKGHAGQHKEGQYGWSPAEGFEYIYADGMVVGTTLPKCEERLDINTRCSADAEQGSKFCRYHGPPVETLKESAKRAPKFYKGVIKVEADKDGVFPAGSLDVIAKSNKTIAERLAERKALNASLTKPKP